MESTRRQVPESRHFPFPRGGPDALAALESLLSKGLSAVVPGAIFAAKAGSRHFIICKHHRHKPTHGEGSKHDIVAETQASQPRRNAAAVDAVIDLFEALRQGHTPEPGPRPAASCKSCIVVHKKDVAHRPSARMWLKWLKLAFPKLFSESTTPSFPTDVPEDDVIVDGVLELLHTQSRTREFELAVRCQYDLKCALQRARAPLSLPEVRCFKSFAALQSHLSGPAFKGWAWLVRAIGNSQKHLRTADVSVFDASAEPGTVTKTISLSATPLTVQWWHLKMPGRLPQYSQTQLQFLLRALCGRALSKPTDLVHKRAVGTADVVSSHDILSDIGPWLSGSGRGYSPNKVRILRVLGCTDETSRRKVSRLLRDQKTVVAVAKELQSEFGSWTCIGSNTAGWQCVARVLLSCAFAVEDPWGDDQWPLAEWIPQALAELREWVESVIALREPVCAGHDCPLLLNICPHHPATTSADTTRHSLRLDCVRGRIMAIQLFSFEWNSQEPYRLAAQHRASVDDFMFLIVWAANATVGDCAAAFLPDNDDELLGVNMVLAKNGYVFDAGIRC